MVDMSSLVVPTGNGMQEYKVDQGFAMSMTLKYNDEVAVAQSFLSAGTIFPYHNHENSAEVLIVYSGEVTVVTENERYVLKAGDSLRICQGCGHLLSAKMDVKIIAITIPPDSVAMPKFRGNGSE